MTILFDYQSQTKLHIAYKKIVADMVEAVCDYVACPYECEVSVSFVDNNEIKKYNKEFRGINKATDVLSFPLNEAGEMTEFNPESNELMLGDIVLSVDKIISQAQEYGHTKTRELAFLTCHSMLHLFGYDHEEDDERIEMEDIQRKLLDNRGYKR